MPSDGMRGFPTSDMPMIGHGFGFSWQKRWNDAASFSGRIARLPCTKPLATPAVLEAMPARHACRAATLGGSSVAGATRSILVALVIVQVACYVSTVNQPITACSLRQIKIDDPHDQNRVQPANRFRKAVGHHP